MISNLAYIDPEAKIGNNVEIAPFAYVDKDVEIGDDCIIMPYSGVLRGTRLGKRNKVHGHTLLGVTPQDFHYKGEAGSLIIGDDNEIRENVVIAHGTHVEGATRVGNKNHIMEKVHICHDADIHDETIIGIGSMIGGNAIIENKSIITNDIVIQQDCHVGRLSLIQSGSRVYKDVPPYIIAGGNPVIYHGINVGVLKYLGVNDKICRHLANAYRLLFKGDTSMEDSVMKIKEQIPRSDEIDNVVKFLLNTTRGVIQVKY